ncbi:MAG: serine hydrolase domain-containing protein, partial [Christensenellales bacterium]
MRPKWIAAALAAFITIFIYGAAYAAPAGRTPSGIPYGGMEARIDGYVGQHIGKTSPGAAVVVVKDGRIIFSKGYGYADVENNLAVDPAETVFEYASVSKLFVYVTLMRLAEEGKLDLDADIRAYLPEGFLKKLRYDEPITFMHVMNHTAGFEDYLLDLILTSKEDFPS